ncbi:MAG: metallophosphoesterase [Bacteroidales bacterium]|jgi:UDP-2,3-diacylglucosamine pyrophosphatase LpxH|nr:metallophosphoesterase [Bacteroidales bacterium]
MANILTTSRREFLKKSSIIGAATCGFSLLDCASATDRQNASPKRKLSFAFLTDVHLNYENDRDRYNGFLKALQRVRESDAEFIIMGGDSLDVSMNHGQLSLTQADEMFTKLKKTLDDTGLPYYHVIGNHERYFDSANNFTAGDELFKKYFEHSYYSFEKKGVRFIILNSVQKPVDNSNPYYFYVDGTQFEWLKQELESTPPATPVVAVMHVPVFTVYRPAIDNNMELGVGYIFDNFQAVHTLFSKHKVKLVLQGHIHWYEELLAQNVRYIVGGSVCAKWWSGAYHGTEEGILLVHLDGDNQFSWEYIDYEWTPQPEEAGIL